jgi:hypothetical protein
MMHHGFEPALQQHRRQLSLLSTHPRTRGTCNRFIYKPNGLWLSALTPVGDATLVVSERVYVQQNPPISCCVLDVLQVALHLP